MYITPPRVKNHLGRKLAYGACAIVVMFVISFLTVRAMNIEDAHSLRRSELMQNAPETLLAPVRSAFMSDACYNRAVVLFAEHGDWATNGNYSEMELCD